LFPFNLFPSNLGWFGPGNFASLPQPRTWQGYVAMLVFIILIAATVTLEGQLAWAARVGLCAAYVGFSYLTYAPD
jgi:hypothetical protein